MSFDVLQEKIIAKKNPTVAGLDAKPEYVPEHIRKVSYEKYGQTLLGAADAIWEFNKGLIDALYDVVPAVKPQAAYYERLGWAGMALMEKTIRYAHEKGLYVIADIKRGDIGSTAEAYSDAWLGATKVGDVLCEGFNADCVTLNGYMGSDSVNPFLKTCKERDKSVFVLVKTSNPGSGELQNVPAGADDTVYGLMAELIEKWGAGTEGKYGYTMAGAVAGATHPDELKQIRARMPHTFLLVPGYGAQGGTAEDVQYAFQANGHGAIVNSSRGIMCAWQKTGKDGLDYQQAARNAAIAMRDDIARFTTIA
ncbi:orotidine-5'-phosphate decarboxylase [Flavonifractor hominis]|uniref:Orotidine 5'-phosphate decarboxylase n=1 Tax=Flavonifractor hominis TaxID=3133178 RepID=A0ABV1EKE4_9FIRM